MPKVQIFKNQQPISVGVLVRESAECLTKSVEVFGLGRGWLALRKKRSHGKSSQVDSV